MVKLDPSLAEKVRSIVNEKLVQPEKVDGSPKRLNVSQFYSEIKDIYPI
jgi:hypothetical protein